MESGFWSVELKQWLEERSAGAGFDLTGVAPVDGPEAGLEALDTARFSAWVEAGRAGEMEYLKRRDEGGRLLRTSIKLSQPWANSVVVCAMNYRTPGPLSVEPSSPVTGWIGRYAWSGEAEAGDNAGGLKATDYHDSLLLRLRRLAGELDERTGGTSKCYVDTGPMVERSLAARAGVGWIGKNTCVINQEKGSWLLLGVVISSLRMAPEVATLAHADRCGSCTRCLDACPTGALVGAREMDASKCIAYLTIEKKGEIPRELRAGMGRQVFGCDICQDVCPWNRRSRAEMSGQISARPELINPELDWLARMDNAEFKRWFKRSPLERTRRSRVQRNVAIAMGNSGEPQFLPQLEAWRDGEDPVLRDAGAWAIERIAARQRAAAGNAASCKETESV